MATYDFTNSWDSEVYIKDDIEYTYTQVNYSSAITDAQNTAGEGGGFLAPGLVSDHGSDLQESFGDQYGTGGIKLLNFVDFDLNYCIFCWIFQLTTDK